jgi:hypothetical protein
MRYVNVFENARRTRVPYRNSGSVLEKCGCVMRMKKRRSEEELGFIYSDPLIHLAKRR